VKAGGTSSREVDLVVGGDVAAVTAQAQMIRGETAMAVGGTSEPGARVSALADGAPAGAQLITTFTAGSDGKFSGALPPGSYVFQAEGDHFRRSQEVTAAVPSGDVALPIPAAAQLGYTIKDRAVWPSRRASASWERRPTPPIDVFAT